MNHTAELMRWDFPGGLTGVIIFAALLVVMLAVSYRWTLTRVSWPWRVLLLSLRLLFTGLLLFCLCAPTRVRETTEIERQVPSVAVLVDESGSMRQRGFHDRTRLDDAELFVRRLIDRSGGRCDFQLYGFARERRRVKDFAELKNSGDRKAETALFENIVKADELQKDDKLKAVIWLTDGIDTANGSREAAVAALSASPIPQLLAPVTTKLPFSPSLELAQLECPGEVRPGAVFSGLALIRKAGKVNGDTVTLVITSNGNEVFRREVAAAGNGQASYPVKFDLTVAEEGTHVFEAELRSGALRVSRVAWMVSAVSAVEQKILLYQGRLTLDQAYLRRVFAEDKRARMTVAFAADAVGRKPEGTARIGAPFPAFDELCKYNIVILNAVRKAQITPQMEKDLKMFLDQGGALLFMVVNPLAANEFAGGGLEKLLPVTFADVERKNEMDQETRSFVEKMQAYRMRGTTRNYRGEANVPPLRDFTVTDDGRRSRIFAAGDRQITPRFQDFAVANGVKPGALLLATVSGFRKEGADRPLLAVQNYGRGRSAVLCTDGMWSWKLSLPSRETDYEVFWQNLLLWLSAGASGRPAWVFNSYVYPAGTPIGLRFRLPPDGRANAGELSFTAERQNDGKKIALSMSPAASGWIGKITPEPGSYLLRAARGEETLAEAMITVRRNEIRSETITLAPDLPALAELAHAAGQELVFHPEEINLDTLLPAAESKKVSVTEQRLWHRGWIFLLLLLALAAELILRRVVKLV